MARHSFGKSTPMFSMDGTARSFPCCQLCYIIFKSIISLSSRQLAKGNTEIARNSARCDPRLFVVDNAQRCHMVDHFTTLVNEKQIVTTVVSTIAKLVAAMVKNQFIVNILFAFQSIYKKLRELSTNLPKDELDCQTNIGSFLALKAEARFSFFYFIFLHRFQSLQELMNKTFELIITCDIF